MKDFFSRMTRMRWILSGFFLLPWLLLWFFQPLLGASFPCISGFLAITGITMTLILLLMPEWKSVSSYMAQTPPVENIKALDDLPESALPITAQEIYRTMSPRDFEIFSAAVVVAVEGHQFVAHSGKRGDRGVDARLRNAYGQIVAVQSKRYAPQKRIGPAPIRDFGEAIRQQNAANGFFVTTATLTAEALYTRKRNGFIHVIDGRQLEIYLRTRPQKIVQALAAIRTQMNE